MVRAPAGHAGRLQPHSPPGGSPMTDAKAFLANIERFEFLLRTSLDGTQRLTVETLLAEPREGLELCRSDPRPSTEGIPPHSDGRQTIAVRNLTRGASLAELREAARDLRALSPGSALADLVDAKIARTLAAWARAEGKGWGN